jgi:hypothetical protein
LNAAFAAAVSDRALNKSGNSPGFFAQPGISPQRTNWARRFGRLDPGARGEAAIAISTGWVGAIL